MNLEKTTANEDSNTVIAKLLAYLVAALTFKI